MLAREAAKREPCACCPAPADLQCWGQAMCRGCHAQWFADPRFEAGAIERAVGKHADVDLEHRAYVAEATKRTKAWVAERRNVRAA